MYVLVQTKVVYLNVAFPNFDHDIWNYIKLHLHFNMSVTLFFYILVRADDISVFITDVMASWFF